MQKTFELVRSQTITLRETIRGIAGTMSAEANEIPPTWNNNVRWHIGHLITTPRLLTFGLLREPLGIPQEYRNWFAKGSTPLNWGDDPVPSYDQLLVEFEATAPALFDALQHRPDAAFPEPYKTSAGVILSNVTESLCFSEAHDGIHLGMLLALKRALKS